MFVSVMLYILFSCRFVYLTDGKKYKYCYTSIKKASHNTSDVLFSRHSIDPQALMLVYTQSVVMHFTGQKTQNNRERGERASLSGTEENER